MEGGTVCQLGSSVCTASSLREAKLLRLLTEAWDSWCTSMKSDFLLCIVRRCNSALTRASHSKLGPASPQGFNISQVSGKKNALTRISSHFHYTEILHFFSPLISHCPSTLSPSDHHIFNWRNKLKCGVSVSSVTSLGWHFGPTESNESSQPSVGVIYPIRVMGVCGILCLEPHTDLSDGMRKPITSHPSWDEHLQGRCLMEMLCVVWWGKAQLPVHVLCQAAALCSWWPATRRETACSYSENLYFFLSMSFAHFL